MRRRSTLAERLGDPDGLVAEQRSAGTAVTLALGGGSATRGRRPGRRGRGKGTSPGTLRRARCLPRVGGDVPGHGRGHGPREVPRDRRPCTGPEARSADVHSIEPGRTRRSLGRRGPRTRERLLRESIALRSSLGVETPGLVNQAVLVSARIGDWPQTLTLAAEAIRGLHWTDDRPLLAAVFNIVARALALSPNPRPLPCSKVPPDKFSPLPGTEYQECRATSHRCRPTRARRRARPTSSLRGDAPQRPSSWSNSATLAYTSSVPRAKQWTTTRRSPSLSRPSTARLQHVSNDHDG